MSSPQQVMTPSLPSKQTKCDEIASIEATAREEVLQAKINAALNKSQFLQEQLDQVNWEKSHLPQRQGESLSESKQFNNTPDQRPRPGVTTYTPKESKLEQDAQTSGGEQTSYPPRKTKMETIIDSAEMNRDKKIYFQSGGQPGTKLFLPQSKDDDEHEFSTFQQQLYFAQPQWDESNLGFVRNQPSYSPGFNRNHPDFNRNQDPPRFQ
jgi:hypothetical protein